MYAYSPQIHTSGSTGARITRVGNILLARPPMKRTMLDVECVRRRRALDATAPESSDTLSFAGSVDGTVE